METTPSKTMDFASIDELLEGEDEEDNNKAKEGLQVKSEENIKDEPIDTNCELDKSIKEEDLSMDVDDPNPDTSEIQSKETKTKGSIVYPSDMDESKKAIFGCDFIDDVLQHRQLDVPVELPRSVGVDAIVPISYEEADKIRRKIEVRDVNELAKASLGLKRKVEVKKGRMMRMGNGIEIMEPKAKTLAEKRKKLIDDMMKYGVAHIERLYPRHKSKAVTAKKQFRSKLPLKIKSSAASSEPAYEEVDARTILRPYSHDKYIQEPAVDTVVYIPRRNGLVPLSSLCREKKSSTVLSANVHLIKDRNSVMGKPTYYVRNESRLVAVGGSRTMGQTSSKIKILPVPTFDKLEPTTRLDKGFVIDPELAAFAASAIPSGKVPRTDIRAIKKKEAEERTEFMKRLAEKNSLLDRLIVKLKSREKMSEEDDDLPMSVEIPSLGDQDNINTEERKEEPSQSASSVKQQTTQSSEKEESCPKEGEEEASVVESSKDTMSLPADKAKDVDASDKSNENVDNDVAKGKAESAVDDSEAMASTTPKKSADSKSASQDLAPTEAMESADNDASKNSVPTEETQESAEKKVVSKNLAPKESADNVMSRNLAPNASKSRSLRDKIETVKNAWRELEHTDQAFPAEYDMEECPPIRGFSVSSIRPIVARTPMTNGDGLTGWDSCDVADCFCRDTSYNVTGLQTPIEAENSGKVVHAKKAAKPSNQMGINKVARDLKRVKRALKSLGVNIVEYDDEEQENKSCIREYCRFGCVCDTIKTRPIAPTHCGKVECMFECVCNKNSKSKTATGNKKTDISSAVGVRIQENTQWHMAAEEKKFTKTVVVTSSKGAVLLGSRGGTRRFRKVPQRYQNSPTAAMLESAGKGHPEKEGQGSSDEGEEQRSQQEKLQPEEKDPSQTDEVDEVIEDINDDIVRTTDQEIIPCTVIIPKIDLPLTTQVWCLYHNQYACPCHSYRNPFDYAPDMNKSRNVAKRSVGGYFTAPESKRRKTSLSNQAFADQSSDAMDFDDLDESDDDCFSSSSLRSDKANSASRKGREDGGQGDRAAGKNRRKKKKQISTDQPACSRTAGVLSIKRSGQTPAPTGAKKVNMKHFVETAHVNQKASKMGGKYSKKLQGALDKEKETKQEKSSEFTLEPAPTNSFQYIRWDILKQKFTSREVNIFLYVRPGSGNSILFLTKGNQKSYILSAINIRNLEGGVHKLPPLVEECLKPGSDADRKSYAVLESNGIVWMIMSLLSRMEGGTSIKSKSGVDLPALETEVKEEEKTPQKTPPKTAPAPSPIPIKSEMIKEEDPLAVAPSGSKEMSPCKDEKPLKVDVHKRTQKLQSGRSFITLMDKGKALMQVRLPVTMPNQYWSLIGVSKDKATVTCPNSELVLKCAILLQASTLASAASTTVRIPIQVADEDKGFGVYAVPGLKNQVFVGPFRDKTRVKEECTDDDDVHLIEGKDLLTTKKAASSSGSGNDAKDSGEDEIQVLDELPSRSNAKRKVSSPPKDLKLKKEEKFLAEVPEVVANEDQAEDVDIETTSDDVNTTENKDDMKSPTSSTQAAKMVKDLQKEAEAKKPTSHDLLKSFFVKEKPRILRRKKNEYPEKGRITITINNVFESEKSSNDSEPPSNQSEKESSETSQAQESQETVYPKKEAQEIKPRQRSFTGYRIANGQVALIHPLKDAYEVLFNSVSDAQEWLKSYMQRLNVGQSGSDFNDSPTKSEGTSNSPDCDSPEDLPEIIHVEDEDEPVENPALKGGFLVCSRRRKEESTLFYELAKETFDGKFSRSVSKSEVLAKATEEISRLTTEAEKLEQLKTELAQKRAELFDNFTNSLCGVPVAYKKEAVMNLKAMLKRKFRPPSESDSSAEAVQKETVKENSSKAVCTAKTGKAASPTGGNPPVAVGGPTPYTDLTGLPTVKKDGSIIRPMNAFMLWSKNKRTELIANGTPAPEVSQNLAHEWNKLSDAEKLEYHNKAEHLKVLHKIQHPHYKYQPRQAKGQSSTAAVSMSAFQASGSAAVLSDVSPLRSQGLEEMDDDVFEDSGHNKSDPDILIDAVKIGETTVTPSVSADRSPGAGAKLIGAHPAVGRSAHQQAPPPLLPIGSSSTLLKSMISKNLSAGGRLKLTSGPRQPPSSTMSAPNLMTSLLSDSVVTSPVAGGGLLTMTPVSAGPSQVRPKSVFHKQLQSRQSQQKQLMARSVATTGSSVLTTRAPSSLTHRQHLPMSIGSKENILVSSSEYETAEQPQILYDSTAQGLTATSSSDGEVVYLQEGQMSAMQGITEETVIIQQQTTTSHQMRVVQSRRRQLQSQNVQYIPAVPGPSTNRQISSNLIGRPLGGANNLVFSGDEQIYFCNSNSPMPGQTYELPTQQTANLQPTSMLGGVGELEGLLAEGQPSVNLIVNNEAGLQYILNQDQLGDGSGGLYIDANGQLMMLSNQADNEEETEVMTID